MKFTMIQISRYQLVKYYIFPLTFIQIWKFIEITHHDDEVINIQGETNEKKGRCLAKEDFPNCILLHYKK